MTDPVHWPEAPSIVSARVGIAKKISLLILAMSMGLFVIERLMGAPLDPDGYLSLFLACVAVVSWGLLKTGRFNSVAWLLVACLCGMAVVSTYSFGSVRTVDSALILVGQIAVGIFLSRRALVWATVGAIVLLGVMAWADASGLLLGAPNFEVGMRSFLPQAACLVGVAAMMYLNRTQMRSAQDLHLFEARQRLQAQLDRDLGQGRFKRIFRGNPTPIYVQSALTGTILDVNPACERALGYSKMELLDKRDGFLWVHDQCYEDFVRDRRSAMQTGWHPVTAIRRDGQHLSLLICRERDEDPGEKLVITVLRRVGEQALPPIQPPQGVDSSSWWLVSEGHVDV